MRQMNSETSTIIAQMNFRTVGFLRRTKYLNEKERFYFSRMGMSNEDEK
jgi:hypothetical protein